MPFLIKNQAFILDKVNINSSPSDPQKAAAEIVAVAREEKKPTRDFARDIAELFGAQGGDGASVLDGLFEGVAHAADEAQVRDQDAVDALAPFVLNPKPGQIAELVVTDRMLIQMGDAENRRESFRYLLKTAADVAAAGYLVNIRVPRGAENFLKVELNQSDKVLYRLEGNQITFYAPSAAGYLGNLPSVSNLSPDPEALVRPMVLDPEEMKRGIISLRDPLALSRILSGQITLLSAPLSERTFRGLVQVGPEAFRFRDGDALAGMDGVRRILERRRAELRTSRSA